MLSKLCLDGLLTKAGLGRDRGRVGKISAAE